MSEDNKKDEELEIVIGDDSNLNISEVGDCINNVRPKNSEKKKQVVIPKSKKSEKSE